MLNRFDTGLAEMFFGQRPVLIEGDTEFAVFETIMHIYSEKYPVGERPVLVRARGKYTLRLLVKILTHFKVPFSILHDTDYPFRKDGKKNSTWKANFDLFSCIMEARQKGINVIHRLSIPNFELAHFPVECNGQTKEVSSCEKPWTFVEAIHSDRTVRESVVKIFDDLIEPNSIEEPFEGDFEEGLQGYLKDWVKKYTPNNLKYVEGEVSS